MTDKSLVCKVRLELSLWPNYLSPTWQTNQNLNDFHMASASIIRAFISVSFTIFTKNPHNVASSIWILKIDSKYHSLKREAESINTLFLFPFSILNFFRLLSLQGHFLASLKIFMATPTLFCRRGIYYRHF